MKRCYSGIMACAGAVIGAGFASGREIVSFFSRFGRQSWWLVGVCAVMLGMLCALCMHRTACSEETCWCSLFCRHAQGARMCTILLLVLTGGAMTSAAGQMTALLWPHEWAYPLGAVGTLWAAWLAGRADRRLLGWIGSGMSVMLLIAMAAAFFCVPAKKSAVILLQTDWCGMAEAIAGTLGYAGMNMTLAIGVVCRSAVGSTGGEIRRMSVGFGCVMALLLGLSNALYLRHPQLMHAPFPLVALLSHFGRSGFVGSVSLLYLAIFSTLIGVIYALDCAAEKYTTHPLMQRALCMCLPLAASVVGFSQIVGRFYAPAGALCLLVVFLPLYKNKTAYTQRNA